MALSDRLRRWWDRVRGCETPTTRSGDATAGNAARPAAARPINPLPPAQAGAALELSIDGEPAPRPPGRHGGSGFDPYANSAGYRKPSGWDGVPRK